ncbi:MAG: M81 family metallopeptidase [Ectothiorhodospiraceae bacterium]|nr:M81 family metallopeptidase [Ectothiorhodospiraceae bacterium]
MARIAIGGFQHETNTFSPHRADLEAFRTVSAFPRLPSGDDLLTEMRELNISIGGFIKASEARGHTLVPTLWAMAVPSAHVTDEAFEHVVGRIVDGIRGAGALDAVYLCLHGAMVTESYQDGEGEILRRVREVVGPDVPLVASLDLHSNTTAQMVEQSDALVAYRTYPHVDMARTGQRTADLLQWMLDTGRRPAKALRRTDFLIPLVWQCSMIEPAAGIYAGLDALETGGVRSVSFSPGFPPADIAECGPSVFAYGDTQADADRAADAVFAQVDGARARWNGELLTPDEAVRRASAGYRGKPFVLADTQDNPGAGGASDTVGLLEALVRLDARDAVFACVYDPPAAAAAHAAGVGATLTLAIGAGSGQPGQTPFSGTFTVDAVSDGEFVGTGPMAGGRRFRMGPCALLRIGGVRVLVASGRAQVLDQAILRHIGIDPTAERILAIKSSVHFRADFQPIAEQVLVVVSPGPNFADHTAVTYSNLRPGIALMP